MAIGIALTVSFLAIIGIPLLGYVLAPNLVEWRYKRLSRKNREMTRQ